MSDQLRVALKEPIGGSWRTSLLQGGQSPPECVPILGVLPCQPRQSRIVQPADGAEPLGFATNRSRVCFVTERRRRFGDHPQLCKQLTEVLGLIYSKAEPADDLPCSCAGVPVIAQ